MIQSLCTLRYEKSSGGNEVFGARRRNPANASALGCAARPVLATAAVIVTTMHFLALTTAWAQDANEAPAVISTECYQVLSMGKGEALIKLTNGQLQGDLDGAPLIKFPAACLLPTQPVVSAPPVNEKHDANSMRSTLNELIKSLEKQGVPPENLAKPKDGVDGIIGRNEERPDVREPVLKASEEASKGDDATTAALLGLLTAGCVAYTGGSACALLPAIFGDLFKGKVTQEQIEGASRIATKIAKGQFLDDDDYAVLKDLGAKNWATDGLRALQAGKYEQFIVAVGENYGASHEEISLLKKLAKIAETGVVTCAVLDAVIGSKKITLNGQTRRAVDEIVFRSPFNLKQSDREELKNCLDLALAGGG